MIKNRPKNAICGNSRNRFSFFFFSKFAVPREKRESIVRSRNRENSALAVLHRRSSSRSRYEPVNELPLRGAARSSAIGEGIPAEFVITESKLKAKIRGRVGKDRSVRLISRVRTPFRILANGYETGSIESGRNKICCSRKGARSYSPFGKRMPRSCRFPNIPTIRYLLFKIRFSSPFSISQEASLFPRSKIAW